MSGLTDSVGQIVTGDPFDEATAMGPVISADQLDRVTGMVARAVEAGAEVTVGGNAIDRPGFFYEPSVVANPAQDSEIVQREVFGPVVSVQRFTDEEQAIAWANDVDYGLVVERVDERRRPGDADERGAALRLRVGERPHPDRVGDAARRLQAVGLRQGHVDLRDRAYTELKHVMIKH